MPGDMLGDMPEHLIRIFFIKCGNPKIQKTSLGYFYSFWMHAAAYMH